MTRACQLVALTLLLGGQLDPSSIPLHAFLSTFVVEGHVGELTLTLISFVFNGGTEADLSVENVVTEASILYLRLLLRFLLYRRVRGTNLIQTSNGGRRSEC